MIRRDRVTYALKKERERAAAAVAAAAAAGNAQAKRRRLKTDSYTEFNEFEDDIAASGDGVRGSFLEPTPIHLEELTLDDVKQALLLRMDRLEQNVTLMFKRVFTEVIALRKENAILRAKVQEALSRKPRPAPAAHAAQAPKRTVALSVAPPRSAPAKRVASPANSNENEERQLQLEYDIDLADEDDDDDADYDVDAALVDDDDDDDSSLDDKKLRTALVKVKSEQKPNLNTSPRPMLTAKCRKSIGKTEMGKEFNMPFNVLEDFEKFERFLSNDAEAEQRFIEEFSTLYCPKRENFVAVLWRAVMTDYVARHICWGGTDTKKRCGDMTVTIALQAAFQRRFEDDGIFVRNTMKFLRYASDRIKKHDNYMRKSGK